MNILIYRSTDHRILLNSMFTENLLKELKNDYNISIAMAEQKELNLKEIEKADLILIFSHGDTDRIFHKYSGPYYYEDLINLSNVEIFKNKRVLVFSCFTALDLGPLAEENGCSIYFGFTGEINRKLPDSIANGNFQLNGGGQPVDFISSVYSEVFYKLIYKAITENLTFEHFGKLMKLALDKTIVQRLIAEKNIPFKYHSDGAQPVKDTAKGITLLGDASIRFIS